MIVGWDNSKTIQESCEVDASLFPSQQFVTVKNITYLNYACALCNHKSLLDDDVIRWRLSVSCSWVPERITSNLSSYESLSYDDLIEYTFNDGTSSELFV